MKKYQTGIQNIVFEIIKQSKKIDLKYITKKQITEEVFRVMPDLEHPDDRIGQALYQLQRKTKYRRPRIKKFCDKYGRQLGWTVIEEEWLWKK